VTSKSDFNGCNLNEDANAIGGNSQMAHMEVVYRYGSTGGEVVHRHEVGEDTRLPSVNETITLPDRDGERRFVVMARFAPTTTLVEGEAVRSAYTILVKDADQ
jgi:hypothetical protein